MARYEDWDEEDDRALRTPSPFRLSDLLNRLRNRRRFMLLSSLLASMLALLISLLVPRSFVSTAVILPPKQDQSISSLLSGPVGNLSALAGGGGLGAVSLKNPNEVYAGLLQSRTLNTHIVEQFNLKSYYHQTTMEKTLKALRKHTTVELGKDNLISISVQTHDPQLSCQLANAFVDRLHNLNTDLALTDSAQRRVFYEQQLEQEKVALATAETALQETQTRTGILQPSGQADLVARSIASLRSQITEREAQLQSLRTFDAPGNPDLMQVQAQVASLQGQLQQLENSNKTRVPGDIEVPTAQLPKSALEYARKYREVQQHEQVYALLLKQFEAAKIDDAKSAPVIEVVDRAVPAELSSDPPRWAIPIVAFFLALLVLGAWQTAAYAFEVYGTSPEPAILRKDPTVLS